MKIAHAASSSYDTDRAVLELVAELRDELRGEVPDLVLVFFAGSHVAQAEELAQGLGDALGPAHLVGCSASGVVAGRREYESISAVSVWAAVLPGARLDSFWIEPVEVPGALSLRGIPASLPEPSTLLVLGEPFSLPAVEFVEAMGRERPEVRIVGGMASSGEGRGENRLLAGGRAHDRGAVAVSITGALEVVPLVSQACRPFGKAQVVTRAEDRTIYELGGRPALERLKEQAATLDDRERDLFPRGLHVGLAVDATRVRGGQGDYVVRNVVQIFEEEQALLLNDRVRTGQTICFHLQDPQAAEADLVARLEEHRHRDQRPVAGALLFSCCGRGEKLFGAPDRDVLALHRALEGAPVAGFFAAGEVGPIGPRSFFHAFSAVIALFAGTAEP